MPDEAETGRDVEIDDNETGKNKRLKWEENKKKSKKEKKKDITSSLEIIRDKK
jgi:hypothetical protein